MGSTGRKTKGRDDTPILVNVNSRTANQPLNYPTNYIRTTKYTLLTFFPLNMFQQFQKLSNVFFLVNMIIALVPGVSPVFPATTILPLVVVVAVAAARDAYEDYNRYVSDKRANGAEVTIINEQGSIVKAASRDVRVGDLMYIEKGGEIVVDCLIISTAMDDGAAFVETANLDGETNLKPKQAKMPLHRTFNTPTATTRLSGTITCDAPNESLHKWQGKVSVTNLDPQSVDTDNFLLRGCILRNVEWVIAVTVYTGVNTKMFLNLVQKPPKRSRLDTKLNRLIGMILAFQQVVIVILCGLHVAFRNSPAGSGFYLQFFKDERNDPLSFIYSYMTYFVLLSLMMPISLFVSLEFCKLVQAKIMEWDDELTNDKGDHLRARTSSLNEELSQVQYVFSDKTGTLTENVMRFAMAFSEGMEFDELKRPGSLKAYIASHKTKPQTAEVRNFLRLLAFNNNVIVNTDASGQLQYDGSSTDEVALVATAEKNGYRLLSRTSDTMTVEVDGIAAAIDVVAVMPFTAERKMMSVVLKEPDGTLRQYTKGADSCVYARLGKSENSPQKTAAAQTFLDRCAAEGLRTLVCAERIWPPEEFAAWKKTWDDAVLTVTPDRDDKVHRAALEAESKLVFVGSTAIEDKLQDEVPETIHFMLRCGIVVWVLTGDKRETALNIAGTSRLLDHARDLVIQIDLATGVPAKAQIEEATRKVKEARTKGQKSSFVVDGKS